MLQVGANRAVLAAHQVPRGPGCRVSVALYPFIHPRFSTSLLLVSQRPTCAWPRAAKGLLTQEMCLYHIALLEDAELLVIFINQLQRVCA